MLQKISVNDLVNDKFILIKLHWSLTNQYMMMYELHYGYIENKYGNNSIFTDTDSLMYESKNENVYNDFSKNEKNIWFQ